jgi:hypothetical protein
MAWGVEDTVSANSANLEVIGTRVPEQPVGIGERGEAVS